MATTKIFSISADELAALKYIADPKKTDNGRLIFTQGCSADPEQAHYDYEEIRANGTGRSSVLAQHFIVSFKAKLKYAIDQVIKVSENFEDFLAKCSDFGVLVEYNPDHKIDLKFMLAEQKERNPRAKFTRSPTLGWS